MPAVIVGSLPERAVFKSVWSERVPVIAPHAMLEEDVVHFIPAGEAESAIKNCPSVPTPTLSGVALAENPIKSPLVVPIDCLI